MKNKPHKLWVLFLTTLYISAFTFGGGFVIVTFMKHKFVDELHWIDEQEMLDFTALAQSIRHFRIFIAVAEEENITKAAKKLYLTQPTVSVAIKEIEEHYGARFFERINQRLHITEEGKRFLDYAKHFIAMYDEMEIAFKNTDFTGRLRVGASVNIGTYYIPRLIREFRDRYPGINVQVKINTTAVVEKELLDGKLDLALVGGTIQSEHIVAEPLFYEKYTAICAPEHPMAGKTVPLEEFMKEPLLSREKSSGAYEVFQSAVNQTGLTVTPVWESTSQTTLMEAVHYGLGVTIVPEQMIKREVREGRLSQITFSDFSFQNTIHIAYHHSKYLSPSIKKFILLVKTLDPPESVPE